MGELKEQVAFR